MRYSLTKIANELGLSKATVSLVLSGKARSARISAEVEERVRNFCGKVNYVPNIHARRVNSKFAGNLGFLINLEARPGGDNPFDDSNISGIMGGIVSAAENAGFRVCIQPYSVKTDENRVFDWLRDREIDGLIYYGLDIPASWREVFIKENRCVVGIGTAPSEHIGSVNIDNFEVMRRLVNYVADRGRKRFAYFSGIDGSYVSDERKRGFLSAIESSGSELKITEIVSAGFSEKKAEELALSLDFNADAAICANDDMAIGVIKALKSRGIAVPKQIAVAGADNIVSGKYFEPQLTTLDNKQRILGAAAVENVIKMLNGAAAENIVIKSELIIRGSTA